MHRDFKPDNVLVGDDDRVRVLDFGLAREDGDEHTRALPVVPGTGATTPVSPHAETQEVSPLAETVEGPPATPNDPLHIPGRDGGALPPLTEAGALLHAGIHVARTVRRQ